MMRFIREINEMALTWFKVVADQHNHVCRARPVQSSQGHSVKEVISALTTFSPAGHYSGYQVENIWD